MKRIDIDKPTQVPQSSATVAGADEPAWQEAWTRQWKRSAEAYGKLFADLRDQASGFLQQRLDADLDLARSWSSCRSVSELLDLQQKWLHTAFEHYTAQSQKVAEICQRAVSEPALPEAVTPARTETAKRDTPEQSVPRAA